MSNNIPAVFFTYTISFLLFLSSTNWFLLWVYIEINSLIFLSILNPNNTPRQSDSSQTYFLIQSVTSLIFIFGIYNSENVTWAEWNSPLSVIIIALLINIAAAPLHSWLPPTLLPSNALGVGLALSLQNIIPFLLLIFVNTPIIIIMLMAIFFSSVMGPILNWNQNNLNLVLIYSSISHTGWILIAIITSNPVWIMYFLSYMFLTLSISINIPWNLTNNYTENNFNTTLSIAFLFISLAGLPPLLGFFPNIITITAGIEQNILTLILVLLASATLDFFIYSRISFISLVNSNENLLWNSTNIFNYPLNFIISLCIFSVFILNS